MKQISTLCGLLLTAWIAVSPSAVNAKEYPLPAANSRLIGEKISYIVPDDARSLESIAARYQIGLIAMMSANPGVDPLLPAPGSELVIPSLILLPDAPRNGIVINLSELRLYYYPKGENKVVVYPIGIGQLGRDTPITTTRIISKRPNPTWTPTENIRRDYASRGITLPKVVPAGPDNPMGLFALRLAVDGGTYLIHGTNANFGIGMRVSSGCIRLRNEDIEALFNNVPVGTPVHIINEPVKVSLEPDGRRYIEVHQPLSQNENDDPQTKPIVLNSTVAEFVEQTDVARAKVEIDRRAGYPVEISPKNATTAAGSAIL